MLRNVVDGADHMSRLSNTFQMHAALARTVCFACVTWMSSTVLLAMLQSPLQLGDPHY